MTDPAALPIGHAISLPGHFDTPVVLEDARRLGAGIDRAAVPYCGCSRHADLHRGARSRGFRETLNACEKALIAAVDRQRVRSYRYPGGSAHSGVGGGDRSAIDDLGILADGHCDRSWHSGSAAGVDPGHDTRGFAIDQQAAGVDRDATNGR